MKQFRKILSIIVLFAFIAGAYGCGTKSPSDTVKDYLEQVKKGDDSDVKQLLNIDAENNSNKEDKFSDETNKKLIETMKKLTYTINSESVNGDSATVNVKVNGLDMPKLMEDYMKKVLADAFSQSASGKKPSEEENKKQYEKIFSECLDNVTYADRTGDISLKKVDGKWKITVDDSLKTLMTGMNLKDNKSAESKK